MSTIQQIPRSAVRLGLAASRLPLTTAEVLLRKQGDDAWPPALAFEDIEARVDKEVKRHEAALQKPPSLDSLGCLDNLMKVNLDFAIQVPDLSQIFNQALSNAEQQICSYAQEQWNKVTEPLQSALQLPSFDSLQLPGGMGGGSVPTLNYDYKGGSLNMDQPSVNNSGRRENDGSLLNNLYNDLYGPGGL